MFSLCIFMAIHPSYILVCVYHIYCMFTLTSNYFPVFFFVAQMGTGKTTSWVYAPATHDGAIFPVWFQ